MRSMACGGAPQNDDEDDDMVDRGKRRYAQAAEACCWFPAYDGKDEGFLGSSLQSNDKTSVVSQQWQEHNTTRGRARPSKHNLCRRQRRPGLSVLRTIMLLAVPLAEMRKMLRVGAVFTPTNRAELQGDGSVGGGGVFGCVGACGRSLSGSGEGTYCIWSADGPWESGTGSVCVNANNNVPSGQGNGKYGTIASWSVGAVTNMGLSECVV